MLQNIMLLANRFKSVDGSVHIAGSLSGYWCRRRRVNRWPSVPTVASRSPLLLSSVVCKRPAQMTPTRRAAMANNGGIMAQAGPHLARSATAGVISWPPRDQQRPLTSLGDFLLLQRWLRRRGRGGNHSQGPVLMLCFMVSGSLVSSLRSMHTFFPFAIFIFNLRSSSFELPGRSVQVSDPLNEDS